MRACGFCTFLLPLLFLLHVGGTGGQPYTASSPQTPSNHQVPTEALKEEDKLAMLEGDEEEVLEMVLVIKKATLERTIRETYLKEEEPCSHDTSTRLTVKETHVVQESEWGRLFLAAGLGTCFGLLVGGLMALAVAYCCLRFRRWGGNLDFDQKNGTYLSADLIDCGV